MKKELEYKFCKEILDSIFDNTSLIDSTLDRFSLFKNNNIIRIDKRITGLLQRCGNINAVKEFLTYLVFETAQVNNDDYGYQMARLGYFNELTESEVFSGMNKQEQNKILKLMQWQFNRVTKMCDFIIKKIPEAKNKKVLDLGCGIGQLSYLLAKSEMNVTALDFNVDEAKQIQKRLSKIDTSASTVNFIEGDALDLSDIKQKYDIITLADVVEHITEKGKLFSEIKEHLNENATIFIHTDNHTKLKILQFIKRSIYLCTFRNPMKYNIAWSGAEGGHTGLQTPVELVKFLNEFRFISEFVYDKDTLLSHMAPALWANGFMLYATLKG